MIREFCLGKSWNGTELHLVRLKINSPVDMPCLPVTWITLAALSTYPQALVMFSFKIVIVSEVPVTLSEAKGLTVTD